ncbi:monoglyceride lipase-like [Ciona intestinalis]
MTDASNHNDEKANATEHKTSSGKPFSEVDHFINADGNHIFCRYWEPSNTSQHLMMVTHGYAEHSGRHERLACMFRDMGFFVFAHDHFGHGESEGYKVNVDDYNIYIRDMLQHVNLMKKKFPGLPIHLYGHSMGGALSLLAAHQNPGLFTDVVLSAPMIAKSPEFSSSIKRFMAEKVAAIFPHFGVAHLDANTVSRDPEQVERYVNDKLNYTGKVQVRMALQLYQIQHAAIQCLPKIDFPFLVIHGTGDRLCSIEGSKLLHEQAKSTNKTIKIFENGYHELIHDIDGYDQRFLDDIKQWLNERIAT